MCQNKETLQEFKKFKLIQQSDYFIKIDNTNMLEVAHLRI